jgi:hypothetical protein
MFHIAFSFPKLLGAVNDPFLYAYVFHGGNTWDRTHWDHMFGNATPLEPEDTEFIRSLLISKDSEGLPFPNEGQVNRGPSIQG